MELTKGKMQEAKAHGVPIGYVIMADLIAIGYCETDAYTIAFPENTTLAAQMNKGIRENILASHKFKMLYEEKAGAREDAEEGGGRDLIGKEATARMILNAALKQPGDSRERAELLMKYSDIMGFKKEDVEDDSADNIVFYLPETCGSCPLLMAYNKQAEKSVRPVDMGRVIANAREIMEKASSV